MAIFALSWLSSREKPKKPTLPLPSVSIGHFGGHLGMKQEGWWFLCVYGRSLLYKATCKEHFRAGVAWFQMEKSSLVHMKAAHCMIILHILFTLSQSVPLWLLGQEGPSAKDERRQPISNRKMYPLSWLNPVGLFHHNSGLIAKKNNRDMEEEASKTRDMEGENAGKRTSFENKKVSGFWSFFTFKLQRLPSPCSLPPSGQKDPSSTEFVPEWAAFGRLEGLMFF